MLIPAHGATEASAHFFNALGQAVNDNFLLLLV